jgi:hypothetical protein
MTEVQAAYIVDADNTLVILTTGERKFHINGGWDEETERALREFTDAGGQIQPPRARAAQLSAEVSQRFAKLGDQFNPGMAGHLAKKPVSRSAPEPEPESEPEPEPKRSPPPPPAAKRHSPPPPPPKKKGGRS